MYQNGKVVDPKEVTLYYGSRLKDPSRTQPFPFGLRMITGNAKNQVDTPDKQGNHFWCAGIGGEIGRSADKTFPVCAKTAHIVRQITFRLLGRQAPGQPRPQGAPGTTAAAGLDA
ncbi:DUF1996 domain-containing protein [Micromonospora orduensis]|uniref:DUF1996 domain-containing protein n=1 Tax=Micromonospora orduensis TaxID=1420891 RepID=UPI001FCB3CA0|nr:DUF1996 domain-containing protein [Micromonospora orduensis]